MMQPLFFAWTRACSMFVVSKQRWYAPPLPFCEHGGDGGVFGERGDELDLGGVTGSDWVRKLTVTFWMGSSKGPEMTR